MGSRQELLGWVNGLLQTNYNRVEQLGTGAAYCQILDAVYGDVRLERVKFNANQEYEYVENFKVLQNVLAKHRVDKPIDPTRLIKCRFQDNFEFLQWLKRHWEAYSSGAEYDAVGRRNGKPGGPADSARPMSSASSSSAGAYRARPATTARPRPAGVARGAVRPGSHTALPVGSQQQQAQVQDLTRRVADAKVLIQTAEKERDFYFTKLREIEVYLQQAEFEAGSELESMAKHIQTILYSTEEGADDDVDGAQADLRDEQYADQAADHMEQLHVDEEETF
ncbi:microtubule integrity protein mal3 [Coemansia biformis]|uniref:Microtubule integrity protein mal3 n=1 Tax=Coemansia biformis TaxID=1286918 RepID=A0A9W7XPY6_9FUNG|nr:microtubule integrity protein mal3 [Coemansia biformis]